MKKYSIPITWQSFMRIEVEAENLQEAVTKGLKEFLAMPDEHYLCDSFEIDEIIREENPDEDFDFNNSL